MSVPYTSSHPLILNPKIFFHSLQHEALLGKLMLTAKNVAKEQGLADGYRIVVNNGRNGCQVYFLF